MHPRLFAAAGVLIAGFSTLFACAGRSPGTSTSTTGTGGAGGEGGACPMGPQAMFTLTITAESGPLPEDTEVVVSWSAGTEPAFVLDDKSTWKTLDESNLVCDLDPEKPPKHLAALVCHVWSNGATKVNVTASGYAPFEQTFVPLMSEHCHGPVPTTEEVKLVRAEDAGS
ncbi:MAG: hypothetical protein U0359_34875 [Byssovorax sp.]